MYPEPIQKLIDKLAKLPSIGPKTAERLVLHMLKRPPQELSELQTAIGRLRETIKPCRICHSFGETDPCPICADPRRNRQLLCLVTKPQDINVIEKTRAFNGLYLVIGRMDPLAGSGDTSNLRELLERIAAADIKEVIIGFNPDMEGETTALYIARALKTIPGLIVSRFARGLPMGADVEYADEITLENAITCRQKLN